MGNSRKGQFQPGNRGRIAIADGGSPNKATILRSSLLDVVDYTKSQKKQLGKAAFDQALRGRPALLIALYGFVLPGQTQTKSEITGAAGGPVKFQGVPGFPLPNDSDTV